jgi:hypothetical protein
MCIFIIENKIAKTWEQDKLLFTELKNDALNNFCKKKKNQNQNIKKMWRSIFTNVISYMEQPSPPEQVPTQNPGSYP